MKICSIGFELAEGKVKYQDELVITLDQNYPQENHSLLR